MKRSVVIVGGGIAGLGAAYELVRRSGTGVTLLESKPRFGGRIHTLRHGKWPIELGAEFIHGRNSTLFKLIRSAKLHTRVAPESQFFFEAGRLKRINLWDRIGEVIERIDLKKPDCSFAEFLAAERLNENIRRLARGFAEGFDAAYVDRISAHSMLRAQQASDQMDGEWQGRITQGYSALIRFLERKSHAAGARLISNAKVTHISWKAGSVEVTWHQGGARRTTKADAVIATLPLGVLKARTITFKPHLRSKQAAIDELGFGNVMKVIMVFRSRWWPKTRTGIIQALDEPLPTWWSDSRGPLLTGWAGGPKADALRLLSHQHIEALSLEVVSRVFSASAALLRKQFVTMHCYRWDHDPDVLGAYSYIPKNGLKLPPELAAPIAETLFFAGEATVSDAQTGTVFGAHESGIRVANEILHQSG